MGETNKRHNRKIWRSCPVCKGRVVLGHRNQDWWVYCEDDASHIPQRFFPYAHEAIDEWNVKANKRSNADKIRSMSDKELAGFMCHNVSNGTVNCAFCSAEEFCRMGHNGWLEWLKQDGE